MRAAGTGLAVVDTDQKKYVRRALTAVANEFGHWPQADPRPPAPCGWSPVDPAAAALLQAGIGVHHGDVPRRTRQAIETAARRKWLRCVVRTPTLLEGVDFPTHTVIAAYPPQTRQGQVEVARSRNLAGRAGRGDRYTSGTLIVMTYEQARADKWLRGFRAELPPHQVPRAGRRPRRPAERRYARHCAGVRVRPASTRLDASAP